jgi:predicted site-specific integrase-resolvase
MNTTILIQENKSVPIEYLSTVEAAERLRVSRNTVTRWIESGFFPNARKKNPFLKTSPYEIPLRDIEKFKGE